MTTQKSIFEADTCGRCGGTGNFSYNQVNGTTCFGCNGRGYKLTKRGRAAYEWLLTQRTIRVGDVKVGDTVISGNRKFKVLQAGWNQNGGGSVRNGVLYPSYDLHGSKSQTGFNSLDDTVILCPPLDVHKHQIAAALEYQNLLGKNGKPRKRAAA